MLYFSTSLITAICLGAAFGCLAMFFYKGPVRPAMFLPVPVGIVGALAGVILALAMGMLDSTKSWWSLVAAAAGSAVFLMGFDIAARAYRRGVFTRFTTRGRHYA